MKDWKRLTDGLRTHEPSVIGLEESLKSAVCIPLVEQNGEWRVLFEVRSPKIERQPGDICFPGGMLEAGETPDRAAVRETCEELLIKPEQIEILGLMDLCVTPRMTIYPYAVILSDYHGTFSQEEVAETFTVPLAYFAGQEPERYTVDHRVCMPENFPYDRIWGGKDYKWRNRSEEILFYQYEGRNIWGLTAKMMNSFVEICKKQ